MICVVYIVPIRSLSYMTIQTMFNTLSKIKSYLKFGMHFQSVQQPTYQAIQQTIWITDNVATCISVHMQVGIFHLNGSENSV